MLVTIKSWLRTKAFPRRGSMLDEFCDEIRIHQIVADTIGDARVSCVGKTGHGGCEPTETEAEQAWLRKELEAVKLERDRQKSAAYFAKESR